MTWLAALKALLSLASAVASYLAAKRLVDAGEAEAVAKGLREAHDAIARAQAARRAVDHGPDSVRDDLYNRD